MRNGQNNKRMRGRNNRGGGNRGPNPLSRSYESNGPDIKVRGTAQHVAEKYLQLARDAHSSGDPVMAESYLQHAEHYFRLIAAAHEQFRPQNTQGQVEGQVDEDNGEDDEDDSLNMLDRRFEMPVMPQRPERQERPFGQQPRFERGPRYEGEGTPEGQDEQPSLEGGEDDGFQPRPPRRERFGRDGERRERFSRENGERRPRFEHNDMAEGNGVAADAEGQQPVFEANSNEEGRQSRRERFERQRRERLDRPMRPRPVLAENDGASDDTALGLPAFITGAAVPVEPVADGDGVMRTRRRRGKFSAKPETDDLPEPSSAE